MTVLIRFVTPGGMRRRCDSRCHNAKGASCACICSATYHGAGRNGTLNDRVIQMQAKLLSELQEQGKVTSAVLPLPLETKPTEKLTENQQKAIVDVM